MEEKLAFRSRIDIVHRHGMRDPSRTARRNEVEITCGWTIASSASNPESPAADLRDFLETSIGVSLPFGNGKQFCFNSVFHNE